MSKIAILSDIHANLPALEAVLREVSKSGAERVVFLGDIVGYGASPAECVDWVRKLGGCCVMGNHEEAMERVIKRGASCLDPDWRTSGYLAGLVHSARSLNEEQGRWVARLPFTIRIPGAVCAHGSWDEPENFNYIEDTGSAEPTLDALRGLPEKVGFFGHTHVQEIFPDSAEQLVWLSETRWKIPAEMACAVTVGSVGRPRHETDRRAEWALWDPLERIVEFRKTEYNRLAAAKDIAKAGLPLDSALELLHSAEIAFLEK